MIKKELIEGSIGFYKPISYYLELHNNSVADYYIILAKVLNDKRITKKDKEFIKRLI